jgi:hypothetical protein
MFPRFCCYFACLCSDGVECQSEPVQSNGADDPIALATLAILGQRTRGNVATGGFNGITIAFLTQPR